LQQDDKAGDESLLNLHLHTNRLLVISLINRDKLFEAKSILLDMKAQDHDTEFVEKILAEVEEKIAERKQ
jgi:hypothetical protein